MNIYIRRRHEVDSQHLIDVEKVEQIDDVLASLKKHGVFYEGDPHYEFDTQYVLDEDSAYFEVIVK